MKLDWSSFCIKFVHEYNNAAALLAKQTWRLLTEPNSLSSKVLKARYFTHENFLDAKIGSNPSYVWRSIIYTLTLIRNRVRRRIGSGLQVNIWNDRWLPDLNNPFIETNCSPVLAQAIVNSLRITPDDSWDIDLIKDLFSERDQNLILSIPLSGRTCDDVWMWVDDNKGLYTVKSDSKLFNEF